MELPSFLSSLIIASSATAAFLFAILTYIHQNYKSTTLELILFGSLLCTIFTNGLLIIAFYQASDLPNVLIYPLGTYLLAMFLLIVASFYVFFNKVGKVIEKKI